MPTFGTSAYLKLICLNAKPQKRELRNRMYPTLEGGYDFHRSIHLRASDLLTGRRPLEEVIESIETIARDAERKSTLAGLERLMEWRESHSGAIRTAPTAIYSSPSAYFNVKFSPDFRIDIGGRDTAIHLWNTKHPPIIDRLARGLLASFQKFMPPWKTLPTIWQFCHFKREFFTP